MTTVGIGLWKRWGLLVAAAIWRTFQQQTKRNSSSAVAEIPAESSAAGRCRLTTKEIRGQRCARLFTNQLGTLHGSNMANLPKQQMSKQHFIMQGDMAEVIFQLKKTNKEKCVSEPLKKRFFFRYLSYFEVRGRRVGDHQQLRIKSALWFCLFWENKTHITCLPLTCSECTGLRQNTTNLEPFHGWHYWTILPSAQETISATPVMNKSCDETIKALPKAHGNRYINNSMATKSVKGHFSVTKENHLKALLLVGSC